MLTRDQLFRAAPSVFAETPWHGMSDRYTFIPTIQVVEMLAEQAFYPVKASQSRSRIEGKGEYTRHMIRFRQETSIGAEIPELVLTNSHDGTAVYNFMAGIFRLICSNGLVVQSANFGSIKIKHMGQGDFRARVIDATSQVIEDMPRTIANIESWKALQLTPDQQFIFASAALELRDNKNVAPSQLLAPRRAEDRDSSLWTTSNVIQENMMRGGIRGRNAETGRRSTTRNITSVTEDIRLNKALWRLTEALGNTVANKEVTEHYKAENGGTCVVRYNTDNDWHNVTVFQPEHSPKQSVHKTVEEARERWREIRSQLKEAGYSRV